MIRQFKKKRPPFVRKAQARCDRLYFRRNALLRRHGIAARSELAESIMLVVKALLQEWSQITSRVGWPRGDGHLAGVPISVLAKWTGLNEGRVARAVGALAAAGLLQGGQPREEKPENSGRWIGYATIRRISWRLFYLLGFTQNEMRQNAEAAMNAAKKKAGATLEALGADVDEAKTIAHRRGEPASSADLVGAFARDMRDRLARIARGEKPPD